MSRLSHYAAIWISGLIIFAYIIWFHYVGYYDSKFTADWFALIGLSFMSVSTAPVAYKAFMNGIRTDRDRFIFSYWLIWTLVLVHRCWIIIISLSKYNYPDLYNLWYYSPVSGLIAVGFTLAAGFGAVAPFSGYVPVPKREIIIFIVAAGFSGIIAGIAIGVFIIAGWVN